jgi:predicted DNA-binding transcriptional regulator YafY
MDILKYGADIEVLAPESLRPAVAKHHVEAGKHYTHQRAAAVHG